jgi:hypothetical protein
MEAAHVELDIRPAERLMRRHVLHDHVQHGAVARGDVRQPVGGLNADRARHIARNHRRLARDVTADMARQNPPAGIVIAARRSGDDDAHRLAAVEVRHRIGGERS